MDRGEIARIVSTVVEGKVDAPRRGEVDLWFELACASLFSVAFEMLAFAPAEEVSDEEWELSFEGMLSEIGKKSSTWMAEKVKEGSGTKDLSDITIDFSGGIASRLLAYFSEANEVMDKSGFNSEAARSHACFVGLSQSMLALAAKGVQFSKESTERFMREGMTICDGMAGEIRQVISRLRAREPR